MAERVAANPQIMRRRKAIIEHCFGTIKRSLGYDYFLCRGMRHVATEVNLAVLAYNLKRACNLVGVNKLIAADRIANRAADERTLALVKPHAKERNVDLQCRMESDCEASVDGDHLQQALMNLLLNAIDASGTNGAVALSMSHSADEVEIRVEDSGPGLTAEQQDRLFEAFYTTKSKGTGLGLAVTKTLLEKMGASIVVGNRNGVSNETSAGACFRISLRTAEIS
jgi:C4-dicarboxylate-specific signal transduction histidine kinase